MNNQMKKGVLDLVILAYLRDEDLHGYLIVQKLEPHLKVKESSIYIILTRLLQNGYLSVYTDTNGARKVKVYKITDSGITYLNTLYEDFDELALLVNGLRNDKESYE